MVSIATPRMKSRSFRQRTEFWTIVLNFIKSVRITLYPNLKQRKIPPWHQTVATMHGEKHSFLAVNHV